MTYEERAVEAEQKLKALVGALVGLCERARKVSAKFSCTVDVKVEDIEDAIKENT